MTSERETAAATCAGELRVAVLVGSSRVPRWITLLLEDLVSSKRVWLIGVAVAPLFERQPDRPRPFANAILAADRLLFERRAGLLQAVDVIAWARDHSVSLDALAGSGVARPWAPDPQAGGPHVVLDLTGADSPGAIAGAGQAVWRLRGVPVSIADPWSERASVVKAVLAGSATVAFELDETADGWSGEGQVTSGVCPTHPSSPLLTDAYLAASARQLIVRRLESSSGARLSCDDAPAGVGEEAAAPARPPARPRPAAGSQPSQVSAGSLSLAASGARVLARTVARQARKMAWEQQWFLMIGRQPCDLLLPDPRDLETLLPPPGRYWADPHIVEYGGRFHVFFEEFLYAERRGRIAVTTLDSAGRPGPVSVALDLDSHLSYPDVFVHDGRLFMIPEGASSGRVDLYECRGDPREWAFRRTLLHDTPLVDASVVEWRGRWWLFGSLKKPAGLRTAELLLLYAADDPVTGEWREHRLSPLLADVTNARPAGAPFRRGQKLYRLAQDGSRGYGSGIAVNEVLRMDSAEYDERKVASLLPAWDRRVCGVHTLNRAGDVVVMDGCRWVPRDLRRQRPDAMLD
jgi:hypothetical protein